MMMTLGRTLAFGTLGLLVGISSASATVTISGPNTTADVGGTAVVDVDVTGLAADGPAGSVDFDMIIDGDVFDIGDTPDCTIQLDGLSSRAFFPSSGQPEAPLRKIHFAAADQNSAEDPLSVDGTLWTCNFPVREGAQQGDSEIAIENTSVFDLLGLNELASEGVNGAVTIQMLPTPTDTPMAPTPTNTSAATNTPTSTPTNSPKPTGGGGDDDDGCQVVAPANSGAGWLLLIPAAALLWRRRRSR